MKNRFLLFIGILSIPLAIPAMNPALSRAEKIELGKELIVAIKEGNAGTSQRLIADGADVEARDEAGFSALACATRTNDDTIIGMLITAHADLDARDVDGWTPLMLATRAHSYRIMSMLIEAGADKTLESRCKHTALILAEDDKKALEILKQKKKKTCTIL